MDSTPLIFFESKSFCGEQYDEDDPNAPPALKISIAEDYLDRTIPEVLDTQGMKFLDVKIVKEIRASKKDNADYTGAKYISFLASSLVYNPITEVLSFKNHPNEDISRFYDMVRL